MRLHVHSSRCIAWLAIVATLAMAVLPSWAHALGAGRNGMSWAEVCTPQGVRLVAADFAPGDGSSAPADAAGHLKHCLFCATSDGALGMPPPPPSAWTPAPALAVEPALFLQAPRTLHAWRSAQPRAPPISS